MSRAMTKPDKEAVALEIGERGDLLAAETAQIGEKLREDDEIPLRELVGLRETLQEVWELCELIEEYPWGLDEERYRR